MSNINEYLLWRGDLVIDEKNKFNEIDSMILARFSYLRFDKIEMEEKETIESISNKMKNLDNEEFLYNGDKELITNLGKSERFKNMIVTDYTKIINKEVEKQFGAITIHISNSEIYISYIGTDASINGWKEDLNMAFMDNIPCQIEGKKYLEDISEKYKLCKVRIGGHSKGGNVAIYSAVTVSEKIQNRIVKVDNYDGPGFNKKFTDTYENSNIISKIETFIPQDSIIGRILNHKEKITISLSTEKGIYQHDIYSWQVLKDIMIKSEAITENSEVIDETITQWLEATSVEQRKIFVDSLFEIFFSAEVETFGDISKSLSTTLPKILKKYNEMSNEDKKIMTDMLKNIATSYIKVLKERDELKFQNFKNESIKKFEEFDDKYLNSFKKNAVDKNKKT